MNWSAKIILSPFIKKVKSGFGEYRMVDENNALKAMDEFAKQQAISFHNWVKLQPVIWRNDKCRYDSIEELYAQFELERAKTAQK